MSEDIKPHLRGRRKFYLQQRVKDGPWCIADWFPLDCHAVKESRTAYEWIEAKKQFGLSLTPIQESLLYLHQEERLGAS